MDVQSFCGYWNEAVIAVVYSIHQMKTPVLSEQINRCWRQELLDHRFFSSGIRHGAAAWLCELEKEAPQKAQRLRIALNESRYALGVGAAQGGIAAAGAAAAVGGWLTHNLAKSDGGKAGGIAAGLLGLGLIGKSGVDTAAASDLERVSKQFCKEAQEQRDRIVQMLQE